MPDLRARDLHAQDRVIAIMRIGVLVVAAAVQLGLNAPPLVRHQAEYRPAWVVDAAFVALLLVTAACAVWVPRGRPLPVSVVAIGTIVVLTASSAVTAALPPDGFFLDVHWSFGLVGWHLLVLLFDRVGLLVAALTTHFAVSVVQFALVGGHDRAEIGAAGVVVLSVLSFQAAIAVITLVLRRQSRQAARVAADRDRVATRAALAEQWERDLRTTFAGQLGATLPLLVGLADRTLDPREDDTRHRCALAATQLRRLFAENDDVPDPLVHEVAACVDAAQRRGVEVSLAVSGAAVAVPTAVRRELTAPLVVALSAVRERARVSVLRTDREVRVAVVTDTAVGDGIGGGSALVEVECGTYGEHTRMEARWRTRTG
ncbi:hypothetical protein [Umezawaea sp. Da 62-37]|uniref:hypothetical protein n=1 Tax=Umezawaea sp. Da 62-37 TaxID=3075927 RepID=UPI0028F6D30A|nr:hypothetical protein [Umezawaea sp. Da 62-37]WNV84637.1 hypothetical protein RM788_41805 [Umezawaea sp. Da 62-37]